MKADKDIHVTLNVNGSVYDIETKPYKAKTTKDGNQTVTLQWQAKGRGTFPENDYFTWKPNTVPPPAIPTRTSATQLDLQYQTPDETVIWEYTICLTDGTITVCEDPEVENEVPPRDEDEWKRGAGPKER